MSLKVTSYIYANTYQIITNLMKTLINSDYTLAKISKTSKNSADVNIHLPQIAIPKINIKQNSTHLTGYFLDLQPSQPTDIETILNWIKHSEWEMFSSLNAKFLFFYHNQATGQFTAITDMYATFPLFWIYQNDHYLLSTHIPILLREFKQLTIDSNILLQLISRSHGFDLQTLLKQVQQLPPSSIFTITNDNQTLISSYLFHKTTEEIPQIHEFKQFNDQFFQTLGSVINDYMYATNFNFSCELSAGLDSTLVASFLKQQTKTPFNCITYDNPPPHNSQNPKIIQQFSQKYQLNAIQVETEPDSIRNICSFTPQYPHPIDHYLAHQTCKKIHSHSKQYIFTGHGGDELFDAKPLLKTYQYTPYVYFFNQLKKQNRGLNHILSINGTDILYNKKKYEEASYFPQLQSSSYLEVMQDSFWYRWQFDRWYLSPLADIRMIKLSQQYQPHTTQVYTKSQFWQQSPNKIHLPQQYSPNNRQNYAYSLQQAFINERSYICQLLSESTLSNTGLFNIPQIITDFKNNLIEKYINTRDDTMAYLLFLLKAETYIQSLSQSFNLQFE